MLPVNACTTPPAVNARGGSAAAAALSAAPLHIYTCSITWAPAHALQLGLCPVHVHVSLAFAVASLRQLLPMLLLLLLLLLSPSMTSLLVLLLVLSTFIVDRIGGK